MDLLKRGPSVTVLSGKHSSLLLTSEQNGEVSRVPRGNEKKTAKKSWLDARAHTVGPSSLSSWRATQRCMGPGLHGAVWAVWAVWAAAV